MSSQFTTPALGVFLLLTPDESVLLFNTSFVLTSGGVRESDLIAALVEDNGGEIVALWLFICAPSIQGLCNRIPTKHPARG
jgi:hypothetical protein